MTWSRYEFALTKLRVYQLGRMGFKKVVLMDADTFALQNIDELFWTPSPAFTVLGANLLGERPTANVSTGVMVIEPSESEFNDIMEILRKWELNAKANPNSKDVLIFIEQDLLDMYLSCLQHYVRKSTFIA